MSLKNEIELNRNFETEDEELLLSLIYTNQLLERESVAFLARYELTPIQLNALMIVRDYEKAGIMQTELARRLLINRASTGTLLDNMCERGLLLRRPVHGDRRANHLALTKEARSLLRRIQPPYYQTIRQAFEHFSSNEKRSALKFLSKLRQNFTSQT